MHYCPWGALYTLSESRPNNGKTGARRKEGEKKERTSKKTTGKKNPPFCAEKFLTSGKALLGKEYW